MLRVAAQRLQPVRLGGAGGVPVLLQVHAGQVQLLDRGDRRRAPAARWPGPAGVSRCRIGGRPGRQRRALRARPTRSQVFVLGARAAGRSHTRTLGPGFQVGDLRPRAAADSRDVTVTSTPREATGARMARWRPTPASTAASRRLTAASAVGLVDRAGALDRVPVLGEGFVSPGARKEKSGWLSVKTPAISSMYGPSASVRLRVPGPAERRRCPRSTASCPARRGGRPSARSPAPAPWS